MNQRQFVVFFLAKYGGTREEARQNWDEMVADGNQEKWTIRDDDGAVEIRLLIHIRTTTTLTIDDDDQ